MSLVFRDCGQSVKNYVPEIWHQTIFYPYLFPVLPIRDVVEVPAAGEYGVKTSGSDFAHLCLPASLPHIYDCVGPYLEKSRDTVWYCNIMWSKLFFYQ